MSEALKEIAERKAINGDGAQIEEPAEQPDAPHVGRQGPVSPAVAEAAAALKQIEPVIRQCVGNTLRGLLVSCPGYPPHIIINAIAWQTGNLLAGAFQADLQTAFALRKALNDAFGDGVKKAPIQPPQLGSQPGPTQGKPKG